MSNTNQNALQTFGTAFPLDFVLQNQNQGADLSVLYIVDNVDAKSSSQQIKVVITANGEEKYNLQGFGFTLPTSPAIPASGSSSAQLVPSNAPITPTDTKYNLAIALRPGTLLTAVEESFAITLYNSITAALGASNSCVVNGPITRSSDGALVWYVAFQNDIKTGWQKVSSWPSFANSITGASGVSINNICVLNDGSLFGVGSDTNYYEQADVSSGIWSHPTGAPQGLSMAIKPDGNFIAVGLDNNMWKVPAPPTSAGVEITGSGSVTNAFVLPDNSMVGIGMNNYLWHFEWTGETTGSWGNNPVDQSKAITQVAALPNGQLLAIGKTDGFLYQKESWDQGEWSLLDNSVTLQAIGVKPDGSLLLYSTDNKMYIQQPTEALSFMLEGVSAAAGTGTRSSQVELLFGNVSVNSSVNPMTFKRSAHLDIVNHEGHSYAPLYFGVLGDGTLLNKTGKANDLSVYFETTNGKPIQLGPDESPTKIDFSFSYSSDDGVTELMTFGNKSEVKGYQLNQSGKYPLSTSGVATDDGEGNYKLSGEFKNLASIQTANTVSATEAESKSKDLYTLTTDQDDWSSIIASYTTKMNDMASFITKSGGPLQTVFGSSYKSAVSDKLLTFYEDPAGQNSKYFSTNEWIRKYNDLSGDTSVSNWDIIPAGDSTTTSYNADFPWNDTKFALYVINNFFHLVNLLETANPSAVFTAANVTVNGGVSITPKGIVPCRAVFEFFRLYYHLENELQTTSIYNSEYPIGAQELAKRSTRVSQHKTQMQGIESLITIGKFFISPNGPIMQLASNLAKNIGVQSSSSGSYRDIVNDIDSDQLSLDTVLQTNTPNQLGNYTPFSISTWGTNYQRNSASFGIVNDSGWDQLPPGINLNLNWTALWGSGDGNSFYQYVENNFNFLLQQLSAVMNAGFIPTLPYQDQYCFSVEILPIIPSKTLAAFFYTQYNINIQLKSGISSCLINTSAAFTANDWNIAFAQAAQKFPSGNTILTQSKISNTSQVWDNDLVTHLNKVPSTPTGNTLTNIELLSTTKDFKPIEFDNDAYLVPSQALYDYIKATYEKGHPTTNTETSATLHQPSSYLFNFSEILVSGADGLVTLDISVQNLPGYWDTTFQIPIRKSSSILDPTLKLGYSGNHGRIEILPTDHNYSNANGITPGSRIDFLSGGHVLGNDKPSVSIEEYYGLNLIGTQPDSGTVNAATEADNTQGFNKTGQPVRVKDADLLVQDGRLGVGNVPNGYLSGDFSNANDSDPDEKLRVVGNTYVNGQITTTDNVNVGGTMNVQSGLNIQGNLTVQGGIDLVNNPIVPPGTIIQRLSRQGGNTAPTGWLKCNGQSLTDLMVTTTTPKHGGTATVQLNTQYIPLLMYLMSLGGMEINTNNGNDGFNIDGTTVIKPQGTGASKKYYYFTNSTTGNYTNIAADSTKRFSDHSIEHYICKLPNLGSQPNSSSVAISGTNRTGATVSNGDQVLTALEYLIKC